MKILVQLLKANSRNTSFKAFTSFLLIAMITSFGGCASKSSVPAGLATQIADPARSPAGDHDKTNSDKSEAKLKNYQDLIGDSQNCHLSVQENLMVMDLHKKFRAYSQKPFTEIWVDLDDKGKIRRTDMQAELEAKRLAILNKLYATLAAKDLGCLAEVMQDFKADLILERGGKALEAEDHSEVGTDENVDHHRKLVDYIDRVAHLATSKAKKTKAPLLREEDTWTMPNNVLAQLKIKGIELGGLYGDDRNFFESSGSAKVFYAAPVFRLVSKVADGGEVKFTVEMIPTAEAYRRATLTNPERVLPENKGAKILDLSPTSQKFVGENGSFDPTESVKTKSGTTMLTYVLDEKDVQPNFTIEAGYDAVTSGGSEKKLVSAVGTSAVGKWHVETNKKLPTTRPARKNS